MTAETHPQRSKIVEMIADTQNRWTDRAIAATLDPPLHYSTISRFRRKLLTSATTHLRGRTDKVRALKDLAAIAKGETTNGDLIADARARLQQKVLEASNRRQSWLSAAESIPVFDKDGLPVIDPTTGKQMVTLDHRALAAHDRNNISATELEAKLAGILREEQKTATVNAVIVLPGNAPTAVAPEAQPEPAIDVEFCEIDASR